MYRVGIVGDKDSIMGFLALGVEIFPVYEVEEMKKTIYKLVEDEFAIIYVTEQVAISAKDTIAKYKDKKLPAIIVVPAITGNLGIGLNEVRESAKRAIGADILFGEN